MKSYVNFVNLDSLNFVLSNCRCECCMWKKIYV